MIPPRFKCFYNVDIKNLKRIRVLLSNKYLFTLAPLKKEMGFFIDFPKFSSFSSDIDNCLFPKGIVKDHDIALSGQTNPFCPKLTFHQSGQVHFSKSGFIKKIIAKNTTGKSIYEHKGEHIFTITMQNIDKLDEYNQIERSKEKNLNLPFDIFPRCIKFVGNLWPENELKNDLPEFNELKRSDLPLYWPREDKQIMDLVTVFKLGHTNNPLYLTIKFVPVDVLDKTEKNPLLTIMAGWKFDEMKDGENDAKFIGLIAKK